VAQYGAERVARFLQLPGDPTSYRKGGDIAARVLRQGGQKREPAGTVFSRFLDYLHFVELQSTQGPVPEMNWFVG
jgi:hypothetical protein